MTTAGVPTSYAFSATWITLGSDGNLWFTMGSSDQIGRVTTGGVVSKFTIPASECSQCNPQGITSGPAGNLWFAESNALPGAVGEVTP